MPFRKYQSSVSKNVKIALKNKRKTFKNEEITNGKVLDKMMVDRYNYD